MLLSLEKLTREVFQDAISVVPAELSAVALSALLRHHSTMETECRPLFDYVERCRMTVHISDELFYRATESCAREFVNANIADMDLAQVHDEAVASVGKLVAIAGCMGTDFGLITAILRSSFDVR